MRSFGQRVLASLCVAGCAQSIAITPYPVHTKPLTSERQERDDTPVYWSAYVNLETQDLHKLWQVARADFLLISATVKIPTRSNILVRDFPLFTITKGQVQAQSGLDLLKKIPISSQARDQVSITLEVRYIKGQEALDKVKKILNETVKAAEPFLKSYPLASKIIGSAIPIIDQIVEPAAKRFPSSRTLAVTPEKMLTRNELIAFIIKPIRLVGRYKPKKSENDPAGNDSVPASLDNYRLVECSDMKGMLCRGGSLDRYHETLNARRELSDTRLSSLESRRTEMEQRLAYQEWDCRARNDATDGQQQQQGRSKSSDEILDRERCERTRAQYRFELKQLDHEIAGLRQRLAGDAALSEARRELQRKRDDTEAALSQQEEAAELARKQSDAKTQAALAAANKRLAEAQTAETVARQQVELLSGQEFHLYQKERVREAIYITFDFHPYKDVFEPLILLRDAKAGCAQLTTTVVQQARDHLNANEDLFLADDVDVARRSLTLAEKLIAMQRATETREVGTVLTLIDEINAEFAAPREARGPIAEHYAALQECAARRMTLAPVLQIEQAWRLYDGLETRGPASQPLATCPALASDSAFRLDLLDVVLTNLSTIAGDLYNYPPKQNGLNNQQISGPIIRLLHGEALRLQKLQAAQLPIKGCTANTIGELFKQFSLGCEECMSALAKACAGVAGEGSLSSRVEQRRAAVRDSLNLQPNATCGRPASPVREPTPEPAPPEPPPPAAAAPAR
jgi:hypothetical protein